MNQILSTPKNKYCFAYFKFQLFFSIALLIISILYIIMLFNTDNRSSSSKNILDTYRLSSLYSTTKIALNEKNIPSSPFILGTLSIERLDICYPIISDFSDELLELSICRFYGPLDSSFGNLCIAGHNYNDESFFSKLPLLKIGDIICIEFWDETFCKYKLYQKYETDYNDVSCTLQYANKKEITLVTCNNFTGNRMIFKAYEI